MTFYDLVKNILFSANKSLFLRFLFHNAITVTSVKAPVKGESCRNLYAATGRRQVICMKELLKSTYQFSDYQIAQLGFLAKTLLSEFSKIFIIGLFFRKELPFFLICTLILTLLRTSTGGLHCKTYLSCLVASCFYMIFTFKVLPLIPINRTAAMFLLIFCAVIDYKIGPVTSDVHLPLTETVKQRGRICTVITILFFFILMYIIPENLYVITGFWIIISHTLQLIAAKIRKKGVKT